MTALDWATHMGRPEIVKSLLLKGAELNVRNVYGETPLIITIDSHFFREPHIEVVKILLDGGADPNIPTSNGQTALSIAQDKNRSEVIDLLKQYCATK